MSNKKHLGNAIDDILLGTNEAQSSTEQATQIPQTRGKGRPKADGYERRTFQVRTDLFLKLKMIAAREGLLQKDLLEFVLEELIGKYETKHGEIETRTAIEPKNNVKDIF